MRRLSERDASAMLAFARELAEAEETLPFPPRVLAALQTLIASDTIAYSELDPVRERSVVRIWLNDDGEDEISVAQEGWEEWWPLWWQLRHTHPLCGYRVATGDWTTARKVSDFVSLREFRRTPIYDAFYRGAIDHWLDVGLAPTPTRTRVFIFQRHKRKDFDERDRLVATLLQPYLAARAESAEAAVRGAAALAAVEEEDDDEARRVVLCSRTGVIEFASPASRALLERYVGIDDGRLPTALLGQGDTLLSNADRRLRLRVARTGNLRVLLLDEHDTRIDRLTARERQILECVALGKENEAIALELGLAAATVAKHLEHVYRKLGVPNRTAAAALLDPH